MKNLKFFGLVLALMLVSLVACGNDYGAEVIKLTNMNTGKGYYVPSTSEANTMNYLIFTTANAINDMLGDDLDEDAKTTLTTDTKSTYAMLSKTPMNPSRTNMAYLVVGKVVSSGLELIWGKIGLDDKNVSTISKDSLKLVVTKPDGSELKLSGTIKGINGIEFSAKVDASYTFSSDANLP